MATNTITLSTAQGDKSIAPQQTLIYKGITLFGYGYLDWGTVVNQALVNLMDGIDRLQDSGLSEIQFDLTTYEEEQKRLRAEEFNIWKTGFTDQLKTLVSELNSGTQEQIDGIISAQKIINEAAAKLVNDNYTELRGDLDNVTTHLDDRIIALVNDQISSIVSSIDGLTDLVESTKNTLEASTTTLNQTKVSIEQGLKTFKEEFLATFDKFKVDVNQTLVDNKDYLIRYINEALSGYKTMSSDFEKRILSLEMLSGSLDPTAIQQLIINKINELAAGIITAQLSSFSSRIETIEDTLIDLDAYVDTKINDGLTSIKNMYNSKLAGIDASIDSLTPKVMKNTNDLIPLNRVMAEILLDFDTPEEAIKAIINNREQIIFTYAIANGITQNYKDLIGNIVESLLLQIQVNSGNTIAITNNMLENILEGSRNTAFDELALIKRQTSRDTFQNNMFNKIKDKLIKYNSPNFKFTLLTEDFANQTLYFAFKLPFATTVSLWKTMGLKIKNTRTNEIITSQFIVSDSHFAFKDINFYGEVDITDLMVPSENIIPFVYCLNNNGSQAVKFKFKNGYLLTDDVTFTFYDTTTFTNVVTTTTISIGDIRSDSYVDLDFRNTFFPMYLQEDDSITIPTGTLVNPTYAVTNTKILVPVNKITTTQTGTKELCIKIGLPNGATLTNIVYNDGFSSQTKTFTNQTTFPLTEAEYTTRNLGSTNNYYKDICTTGVLYFPVNAAAKTVKTTITYVLSGTTKTETITTAGSGGTVGEVEVDILSAAYTDIDSSTFFGANPTGKKIKVNIKVYDNTPTSETYQMWINGDNISTVGIKDTGIVRVYNEYTETLKFFITLEYNA